MASAFDTEFLDDAWDDLVATFGISVTYTATDGSPATINAIWEPQSTLQSYYFAGEQDVQHGVIVCIPDDVPSPTRGTDTFAIDGEVWAVVEIGNTTPVLHLQLERHTATAVSPNPHRSRT